MDASPNQATTRESSPGPCEENKQFTITIKFGPESYSQPRTFGQETSVSQFLEGLGEEWPDYDWSKCKVMVEKRQAGVKPLLKMPDDGSFSLSILHNNSLKLMAPKKSTLASLQEASAAAAAADALRRQRMSRASPAAAAATTSRSRDQKRAQEDAQYTFQTIRPLPYLPRPERSTAFLERLRDDPGIRAAMRKHKFTVGLLTEMDPIQYTESNHEGTTRILGLNRNQGEVIELRLRTDAYDGYRNYKVIRNTLCHELAHNVHGPHDRNFWDLCHQIEREVAAADWKSGGRTVGEEEFAPERYSSEETFADHGGWFGGEYVLGGGGGTTGSSSGSGSAGGQEQLTRREIMARAAEQRMKNLSKAREEPRQGGNNGEGSSS
ncbi:WLM-domain-containing protein [Diplogelasinospora grovesii]|uniref:WLM-domain-containing protein n=1 Tax=Diplogelasinospora grovesii TaxID=303347 RepID=A0AAN6NIE9_9PEZI|nr:WLM-domain-containing protein [Diplogelasinospora grovesii]